MSNHRNKPVKTDYRSAINGQFITASAAKKSPNTTVKESNRKK